VRGIFGIISKQSRRDWSADLESMRLSVMHDAACSSGTHVIEEAGVWAGWVSRASQSKSSVASKVAEGFGELTLLLAGDGLLGSEAGRSPAEPDGAASEILKEFQRSGLRILSDISGPFSGCLVDRNAGVCHLFTDRFRLSRLYYVDEPDRLVFASEAKAILSVTPQTRKVDCDGLAQFTVYGCTLEDRTLFSSIRVVPAASHWTFRRSVGVEKRCYFDIGGWEEAAHAGGLSSKDEFSAAFRDSVDACFHDVSGVSLSLTGGLDTRLILAFLSEKHPLVGSYTYLGPSPTSRDSEVASRVAATIGIAHEVLRLGEDFLQDLKEHAERAVFLSDGLSHVCGAHDYYFGLAASTRSPVRLTGNYGSEILHGMDTFKPLGVDAELFAPELAPKRAEAENTLSRYRRRHPVTFAALCQVPWKISAAVSSGDANVTVRTPYMDHRIIRLAYGMSAPPGASRRLVRELIQRRSPHLAAIPTDRGECISLDQTSYARAGVAKLTFKADYLLGDDMPRALQSLSWLRKVVPWKRHRYLDYRLWLRQYCRDWVLDILQDPKTEQRDYLNRAALRSLAREWEAGAPYRLADIDTILTLELVQRQLIQGIIRSGSLPMPAAPRERFVAAPL
jgi:asparagine synthase (glutamine-hydrolysing)